MTSNDKNDSYQNEFYVQDDDLIDFTGILRDLYGHRKFIIAVSAIFVFMAIPFSLSLTSYYRASVLMAPAEDPNQGALAAIQNQLGGLGSFFGAVPVSSGTMNIHTTLAMLSSRTFTELFLETNNLLPILFEEEWDADKGDWKSGTPPSKETADRLVKKLRFTNYDNQKGLITFAIEWTDPELAAEWVNSYVALLNDYVRKQAIEEAQNSIKFLQKELSETSVVSLQTILYGMIEQQTQTIMLADARTDYAFTIIDRARVPEERERPNRTIIVLIAAFSGLTMALFATIFRIYTIPFIKRVLATDSDIQ